MKSLIIIIAALSLITGKLYAQDDEFQKYLEKENKALEKYISEEDKKFSEFLKKEWVKKPLDKPVKPMEKPKPSKPPLADPQAPKPLQPVDIKPVMPKQQTSPPEKTVPEAASVKPEPKAAPVPVKADEKNTPSTPPVIEPKAPVAPVPVPETKKETLPALPPSAAAVSMAFYGAEVKTTAAKKIMVKLNAPVDNKSIASFYEDLSREDFQLYAKEAKRIREQVQLNDWGYVRLLYTLSANAVTGKNERVLFTWYLLLKTGYRARVAYNGNEVALLLYTNEKMYSLTYFMDVRNGGRFYMAPLIEGSTPNLKDIMVYTEDFPGAEKPFSFALAKLPNLADAVGSRKISFRNNGKSYNVEVKFNKGLISFLEYYPQVEFKEYFAASISASAHESIIPALKGMIQGMNQKEAANFLLHFVQQATSYKTDDDQFQREKPFFAEESLSYPYSDCEDRSVLYALLMKQLLGLRVVGLYFPNHIATAVQFTNDIKGDCITLGKDKLLICDPTYMGADIGTCMPDYRNVPMEIIEF